MLCSTAGNVVDAGTVDESRKALATGGIPQFKDGTPFAPAPELLGYLQAVADFGGSCTRITVVPNVLAYIIAMGADSAAHYVVQYPKYDYPDDNDSDTGPVGFEVVSFPAGPWPCIKCQVTDGGTLTIWPTEVCADIYAEYGETVHEVCLVHGTVERLSLPDEDGDLYYEDHAPYCNGSCEGACSS